MNIDLKPYVLYVKKHQAETINILRFSIDPATAQVSLYASDDITIGALNLQNIAAIFPEKQNANYPGYHVRLKNDARFIINAGDFKLNPAANRIVFSAGSTKLEQVYVALSEVVSVIPVKGFDATTY